MADRNLSPEEAALVEVLAMTIVDLAKAKILLHLLTGQLRPGIIVEAGAAVHALDKGDRDGAVQMAQQVYNRLRESMPKNLLDLDDMEVKPSLQLTEGNPPSVSVNLTVTAKA